VIGLGFQTQRKKERNREKEEEGRGSTAPGENNFFPLFDCPHEGISFFFQKVGLPLGVSPTVCEKEVSLLPTPEAGYSCSGFITTKKQNKNAPGDSERV